MISRIGILLAIGCSLALTLITITPPQIPGDWARLNSIGVYTAQRVEYPWPSYAAQVGLLAGMIVGLTTVSKGEKRNTEAQTFLPHPKSLSTSGEGLQNTRQPCPTKWHDRLQKQHNFRNLMVMAVVTLAGFGLRVYSLDRLPLIIDEIGFAAHASDILHGQHVPILAPGHNANPSAFSWLVAGTMAIFGQTAFAARLIPLAAGTLAIPAMYLFGRRWWGARIGMLAAGLLAVYPVHIHFSRMSMYNIFDPLWAMLALGFLPHPLTPSPSIGEGGQRQWILVGMLAGVAQYFYHGARLLPVLMVIGLAATYRSKGVMQRREGAKTQRTESRALAKAWKNILWMGLAFAVVALPRFAPMLLSGLPVTGNIDGLRLPADLGANSLRAVLAWVGQADVSPFWLSDAPLLEWGMLAAFLVGLAVCVRRIDDPRNVVLAAWIVLTTIFGGMIWQAAPLYIRYLSGAPAIMILAARGVEVVSNQWSVISEKIQGEGGSRKGFIILTALICLQGVWAAVRQPDEAYARITASQWAEEGLAKRAATAPEGASIVFVVNEDFGAVQAITLAHSVAAYGERRPIALVRQGEELSAAQREALNDRCIIIALDN